MAENILELNEFFVEGGNPERSHALLHITEPSTPEEKQKGYFFAVCEINNSETKYIESLQSLIDEMENKYYELSDEPEKNAIESVLESANQECFSLVKPDINLHCIIGVLRQNEIIFAYAGSPTLLLFYKNRQGVYQKMDLTTPDSGNLPAAAAHQLFSQIVQGKISPNDFLFAGTPHVTDYFNHDRLQKIITARPPNQSAEHIERVLTQLREGLSFGGLIIHLGQSSVPIKKLQAPAGGESAESLDHLMNTQMDTANTLSSSFLPRFKKGIAGLLPQKSAPTITAERPQFTPAHISAAHARSHNKTAEGSPLFEKIIAVTKQIIFILAAIARGLLKLSIILLSMLGALLRGFGLLFIVATNFRNRRQAVLDGCRRAWRHYENSLRSLPLATKIMLGAAVLLAVVFFASLAYLKIKQKNQAHLVAFNSSVESVTVHLYAADSAMVYHDDAKALGELTAAESALAVAPCQSKTEKKTCSDLSSQLNSLFARARKIQTAEAVLVADFASLLPGQNLTSLAKVNSKLFAASGASPNIALYDLVSGRAQTVRVGGANGFSLLSAPKENDYLLLIQDQNNLFELDPNSLTSKPAEISFSGPQPKIAAAMIYNRRLYTLDSAENVIYKHDAIKTGFAKGAEWSRDPALNIKDGSDLTIDGDVFVLKNNGAINKLTKGVLVPFTVQGLSPGMANGGKLWTYNDVNYLYVLDPAGKRLLIMDKDGGLKSQIISPEFQNPSDMAIDEPNKLAYIIDGTKLYKINLP